MRPAHRTTRWGAILVALLATLGVGALPALAEDGAVSTISGTMADPDGAPLAGVRFTVTGPNDFSQDVESDAAGAWSVEITTAGQYFITIDPESLPDGVDLRDPEGLTKTAIIFNIGVNPPPLTFPTGEGAPTIPTWRVAAQLTMDGIVLGLTIALAAVGLSLIFGTTGLTNFAHGELITLGALATLFFNKTLGLHLIPSVVLAMVVAAALGGWIQNKGLWQPLRRRGTGLIAMLVVSIGLGLLVRYVFLYFFGGDTEQFRQYAGQAGLVFGPITITPKSLIACTIAVVLLVLTSLWLTRTRNGKASRAIADNPALASASGIEVEKVINLVWIGGAVLAAFSGVIMGLNQGVMFLMGSDTLLLIFAAVTLGGLGTAYGAIVGSMVVGLFIQLSTLIIPTELKYVGALLVLIIILLVRPQGILGRRERIG